MSFRIKQVTDTQNRTEELQTIGLIPFCYKYDYELKFTSRLDFIILGDGFHLEGELTSFELDDELKRKIISDLAKSMLDDSFKSMKRYIERVVNSGCIDIDTWNPQDAPMVLPKAIITATLEQESTQYLGTGTKFERKVKSIVRNIRRTI
jgi:hypothetical protein